MRSERARRPARGVTATSASRCALLLTIFSPPLSRDADPSAQYDWPPRDPYSSQERALSRAARQRARARLAASEPFTAGGGTLLNPSSPSLAQEDSTLRQRRSRPKRTNVSPYHDAFEPAAEDDGQGEGAGAYSEESMSSPSSRSGSGESDEDDEDVPLGQLVVRGVGVRVRRGSEGYEVRPMGVTPAAVDVAEEEEEGYSDHSWEEGRISEGELDEQGDRRRVGARYKRYVREESSDEESSADSLDDYLEEQRVV